MIKTHLVEDTHYKASKPEGRSERIVLIRNTYGSWTNRRSKTVSEPAVAFNSLKSSASTDWTAATQYSRRKFLQLKNVRGAIASWRDIVGKVISICDGRADNPAKKGTKQIGP